MRTIDADLMKAEVESWDAESNNRVYQCVMEDMLLFFIEFIDKQPTIEPEVRHGRWVHHSGGYSDHFECTACGDDIVLTGKWRFCPNCGADMREVSEDAVQT